MREEFRKDYKDFIDAWGEDSQVGMCLEEMAELSKELLKMMRYRLISEWDDNIDEKKAKNSLAVKEEIADVLNMCEQLEYMYGEEEIEKIREQKIIRTRKLLNKGQ